MIIVKRKFIIIISIILVLTLLVSCKNETEIQYEKHMDSFFDTFDTVTQVVGYTKTEEEFNNYFKEINKRFIELHKLYDIYNSYEGINNVKTINDNAGKKPIKVDKEVIDLILLSKEWYDLTEGKANIAMGSVLSIWHDYREEGIQNPENAKLPSMEDLLEAKEHTNIDDIIVDIDNSTVYLADEKMRLDVGSIAKGYAVELVAKEIMEQGFTSGIINGGGNVRVLSEKPLDGVRERWGIGLQNPSMTILPEEDNILDTVFINDASVVSSGDYQRYYLVDGKYMHHIIDPETLMPGQNYSAVTIVTQDSGFADYLSTVVYLMPYDKSKSLVDQLEGVEALWVMHDGEVKVTDGMKKIIRSHGATGAKSE